MKKTRSFTTRSFILGLALSFILLTTSSTFAAEYVCVIKDGVNIRSGPTTGSDIRWEVFAGFPLQVQAQDGKWTQVVDFEGDSGWIYSSLVSSDKKVIVKRKKVNLRQEPNTDTDNKIIAVVDYGVVFTPVQRQGDWLKVRYDDGTEGWINRYLVWPSDPLE